MVGYCSNGIRTLLNPLFIGASTLFVLNQLLEKKKQIYLPWIHAYLDDVLCMPVVLSLALFVHRSFVKKSGTYIFSPGHTLVTILVYSIAFEGIFPNISSNYTRDYFDIAAYIIGGLIFHCFINIPLKTKNPPKV